MHAQVTFKITNILELSGGGATASTNFKNDVEMAVKKINAASGVKAVADISTDFDQIYFSAPVLKAKQPSAEALFVCTNNEAAARTKRELRKQGWSEPVVGETTLTGQKVISSAGESAQWCGGPRGPDRGRAEAVDAQVQSARLPRLQIHP